MINVIIPLQEEFEAYKKQCKDLYERVKDEIGDTSSFEFICENTLFYLFVNDKHLIGAIYYFKKPDNKLYLNAFANRKMHALCIKCLQKSLTWFKGRIYAEAQNRASAICLIRCGFKRVKGKMFMFENSI